MQVQSRKAAIICKSNCCELIGCNKERSETCIFGEINRGKGVVADIQTVQEGDASKVYGLEVVLLDIQPSQVADILECDRYGGKFELVEVDGLKITELDIPVFLEFSTILLLLVLRSLQHVIEDMHLQAIIAEIYNLTFKSHRLDNVLFYSKSFKMGQKTLYLGQIILINCEKLKYRG